MTGSPFGGSSGAARRAADRAEDARDAAEGFRDETEAARDLSETYANAAATAADFYDTIALGRAGVADTETFGVVAGGSDGLTRPTLYRRDSSSTQTMVTGIVAPSEPEGIAARGVGYLVPPSPSSPLYRVRKIEIYKSVNGVAVTLPALFCVRECGRDLTVGGRFRLRLASFDGTSTYTVLLRERGNGTYLAGAQNGVTWVDMEAASADLGFSTGTLLGRALIDFGADAVFGTYAGTIAWSVGGINPAMQQAGPQFTNDATEVTNDALALSKDYRLPFADAMTNTALRRMTRDINVYVKDADRDYSLRVYVEELSVGSSYRLRIEVIDVETATVVTGFSSGAVLATSVTDFLSSYGDEIGLNDGLVTPRNRATATCVFDWSSVTTAGTYGGATVALGGINHANVVGYEEALRLRRDPPALQTVRRVGSGLDYTDVTDAVESFYAFRTGSALQAGIPLSDILHPRKPGQVRVVEDGRFEVSNLYLPHDLNITGHGAGRTILENSTTGSIPVLQAHASGVIERMTLIQNNSTYYVTHVDLVNQNVGAGVTAPVVNTYRDVDLIIANAASTQIVFGSGVSSGNEIYLENVRGWRENSAATSATYFFHNSGPTISTPGISPSTEPSVVRMDSVTSYDQLACEFQTLEPAALCDAILNNCHFNQIKVSASSGLDVLTDLARDRNQWRISGNYDGPWLMVDPVGWNVLKTSAGETPTGDAAALIFGATDAYGRGEKWIAGDPADATTYSLGERLGDCSSVNKTLTIGAQTHTFTADLTAVSNATIISAINASITTHPVSIVDVQLEWAPECAPRRRVRNSTGATIPKGRFVRFTGASTIALCGAGERPEGWTIAEIANGADGDAMITRRIDGAYIDGAASGSGDWGITTAGTLDYSAAAKLGRTVGGIVEVWQ